MYPTTAKQRRPERLPQDSGEWAPAPRPFRRLPVADNFSSRSDKFRSRTDSCAPVIVAWVLVLAAYSIPLAVQNDLPRILGMAASALFAPAAGTLWVSQFYPVKAKDTLIRSILWALAGATIFGAVTPFVCIAIALAPFYVALGLFVALFTNHLLNPRNE